MPTSCRVGQATAPAHHGFDAADLSAFCSPFEQNCFYKFLLPRNRGRRWPTGRMRGLPGLTTCAQSPLPQIVCGDAASSCSVQTRKRIGGEGTPFFSFPMEQIQSKDAHAECICFAQPRGDKRQRRPTNDSVRWACAPLVPPYNFTDWPPRLVLVCGDGNHYAVPESSRLSPIRRPAGEF